MMMLFLLACIPDDVCLQDTDTSVADSDTALSDSEGTEGTVARYTATCEGPPTHDVVVSAGIADPSNVAVWAHTSEWGWAYMEATGVEPVPWWPVEPTLTANGGVTVTCEYVYPLNDPNRIGGFIADYFVVSVY